MRLDDRFMTFLTAMVLIVAIGALFHGNGTGSSLFSPSDRVTTRPDNFTVLAGRVQPLEVLLNDNNGERVNTENLFVVEQPSCGYALALGTNIQYSDSLGCVGKVAFTYCVEDSEGCEATLVTLNVLPGAPL